VSVRISARFWTALAVLVTLSCAPGDSGAAPARGGLPLGEIKLPPGFAIEVYSDQVPNARQMALSPAGILYVGSREEGKVYAVVDQNRDGRAEKVHVIAKGLKMPSGVAFRDGALYVGDIDRILRWDGIDAKVAAPPQPAVVSAAFPSDRHHGWKFIAFGPDGMLYVPVGAPCNVCDRGDPYNTIWRMRPDGSGMEIYARGVRNTVGFDWHPTTRELWFTDNGRDNLANDSPGDELNRISKAGLHFGYPFCHEGKIADPEFGAAAANSNRQCSGLRLTPVPLACGSTPAHSSRSSTATRFSSPSTDRGIGARELPTPVPGYRSYASRTTRP
jgi:glucose/arabinose dehydrogenase